MRLSQAPDEAKTFLKFLGEALKEIHPDYEQNTLVRGVRSEYCREISPGLHASHNVYCKKGRYHHGFCLTLHKELPTPYLLSPFTVGGRFDHNHSVNMAFQRDLKHHVLLSDSHEYRKGCDRIIRRCSAEAETHLLPHYLSVFKACQAALLPLAQLIESDTPIPETKQSSRTKVGNLDMPGFRKLYDERGADRHQLLLDTLDSTPELFRRLREKRAINLAALQGQ